MSQHRHAGVPCSIAAPGVCTKIHEVLRIVRRRFPRDHGRLLMRVAGFRRLTKAERAAGTAGQFLPRPRMIPHPVLGQVWEDDDQQRGVIALGPDASRATVAHELGHAAATYGDQSRRRATDDEWASELTADWYAYRWGFGRDIAKDRPTRRLAHHCVGPGQVVGLGDPPRWFRVSRRFVMHPTSPPAGRARSPRGE